MTLTLSISAPDLALVQTLFRYAVAGVGLVILAFNVWMENKQ